MKTIFLAVTGTQGSGKSIFCDVAKEKFDIPSYRLGDIIIQECTKRGLEVTGRNMAKMATVLRYEGGPQAIAVRALPEIKKIAQGKPIVLIDGIRSGAELTTLEKELGKVTLVAIIATTKTRQERVETRKRIDHESMGDFEEREERELGFGLGNIITKADHNILNEQITIEQFKEKITNLLEQIIKKK